MNSLVTAFRRTFSLDLRSIAVFRMALGALILLDLFLRSFDLATFYTDAGVLPRTQWAQITHHLHWSLHAANGQLWFQILLFALSATAALMLLIGYRSRLMAAISFVMLASLLNRNLTLIQGGDILLVVLSFWSMFLPLGARWSVDAALKKQYQPGDTIEADNGADDEEANRYLSVVSVAVIFQVLYLYFFTALLKTGAPWTEDFNAAWMTLNLQHFATPVGEFMTNFPLLLKLATVYVLAVEFAAPCIVLLPFAWPRFRLLGLALLASLHVAFILMMHIGLFPLIDFAALSLLLPGAVWQWQLRRRAAKPRPRLTIHYDIDCGFCLKMCLILRALLLPAGTRIVPAQSDPVMGAILERENSWVVADDAGNTWVHWHAMARLFREPLLTRPIGWLMALPPFIWIGNALYRSIADNRPRLADWSTRFLAWRPVREQASWTTNIIALYFFYIVTAYNIYQLPQVRDPMPKHVSYPALNLRIDQKWDMFAPSPLAYSAYYSIQGKLRNGELVNLMPRTEPGADWEPPSRFYPLFDSYRWRKYLGRVDNFGNNAVRDGLGAYFCKTWNRADRRHDEQLGIVEIYVTKFTTNKDGGPKTRSDRMIWQHWCYPEFRNQAI
ncbi:MAG: HTTM domain-containing protein [Gammaproteobacteria bacterium]|nr:MAG: HTTM domain-containing protein [Gammaproteobacteria bacterium]